MRKLSKTFRKALPVIFFTLLAFAPACFAADVVERILAVVNDEIVTEQDLQIVMAPVLAQYRTSFSGKEYDEKIKQARKEFLDKVIEDKLVLSEAKKRQVIVKDAEVDEMLAEVRNKFPNRDVFIRALEDQGLTEKKLWDRMHDQLYSQKLVAFEVKSKVSVSPGEVSDYYKAHPEEFAQGDRIRLQQILIRLGSRTDEEAKAFALSLYNQLKAKKSFEELAKAYSEGSEAKEGGEMGWIEKGQLMGEIDQRVFVLEPGDITEPISTSLGYHIFKVEEREKFSTKPLSEVRDMIQDKLFQDKLRVKLDEWIKGLKKKAYISIR